MGNTQAGPKSRDELAGKTIDTQNMINEIFKFMFTKLKIPDFTNLSDTEKCKKYILFKANALNHYFNQVQIVPTKNSSGVIAFRKYSEMTPETIPSTVQQQSLCLMIAYYYTRIFQIYGALALTLLDDVNDFSETQKQTQRTAPGFNMSGGKVPPDELGAFGFLSEYLTENIQKSNYKVDFKNPDHYVKIFFTTTESESYDRFRYMYDRRSSITTGKFEIYLTHKTPIATFTFKEISPNKYRYEFGNVSYEIRDKKEKKYKEFTKLFGTNIIKVKDDKISYVIKDREHTDEDVKQFFDTLFTAIIPEIVSLYNGNEDSTVPEKVKKGLDIKKIIDKIKPGKNRPRGHCIARALQLLNTTGNLLPSGNMTSICATFDNGLPKKNETLSSSPGLHALANLFYDTIQSQNLKIGIEPENGTITLDKYIDFMKKMAQQYDSEKYEKIQKEDTIHYTIDNLKYTRNNTYCKTDKEIGISQNVAISVNENVKELFNIQYQHAIECGKIFNMLFKIKRDTSNRITNISLSDKIYKIGFPEIQNINNHARNVLVNYYTSCENEYIKGSKKIFESM